MTLGQQRNDEITNRKAFIMLFSLHSVVGLHSQWIAKDENEPKHGTVHNIYIVVVGGVDVSSGAILPVTRRTVPKAQVWWSDYAHK